MQRLVISPISDEIYWATVKQDEYDNTNFELTGKKECVTKQALDCVYQYFISHAKREPDGVYAIRMAGNAWLRLDLSDNGEYPKPC